MSRAKVIFMMSQSNSKGAEVMSSLQSVYSLNSPYSNIKIWNGASGFVNLNSNTNTNQYPEINNKFGIEFKLMTAIQSYYNDTVYIIKPSWGSNGLQNGAGSLGTYDPFVRGNTVGKYDIGISEFNSAINSLFPVFKNNIDLLAYIFIGAEADAKNPYAQTWETALTNYINKVRKNLNKSDLPFIICKLNSSVNASVMPEFATVNTGSDSVANSMQKVHTINTNLCTLQADLTHYTADGYETLGGLVYNVLDQNGYLI